MLARCTIMSEVLLGEMYSQSSIILKHIVPGCDLVHQKSKETEAVCFSITIHQRVTASLATVRGLLKLQDIGVFYYKIYRGSVHSGAMPTVPTLKQQQSSRAKSAT